MERLTVVHTKLTGARYFKTIRRDERILGKLDFDLDADRDAAMASTACELAKRCLEFMWTRQGSTSANLSLHKNHQQNSCKLHRRTTVSTCSPLSLDQVKQTSCKLTLSMCGFECRVLWTAAHVLT